MNYKRSLNRKLSLGWEQVILLVKTNQVSLAVWSAALVYCTVLLLFFFGSFFRTKFETCRTNRSPNCPDFIIPELKKYDHELLYLVPSAVVAAKIQANLPQARQVTVVKKWPNSLETQIVWLDPIAQVGIPASTSAYLVADTGKIIGSISEHDLQLPLIIATSAADLIINDTITDDTVNTAFETIKYLYGSANPVESIMIDGPFAIRAHLQKGHTVLMTSTKPVELQVRALQLILSQTTMDQRNIIIDVRYDKSVIKPVPH